MSIPDFIGTGSKDKFISPLQVVMRGEIDGLNALINEIKIVLTEKPESEEAKNFVTGTGPDKWRNAIKFETGTSSQRFISFLGEKRDFLLKWLKELTLKTVDFRLISNIKGVLQAFYIESLTSKGSTTDNLSLEFKPLKEKESPPKGAIELVGLSLIAGHWNQEDNKLEVTRYSQAIEGFPHVAVTLGKATNTAKTFMCPLLRTMSINGLSRSGVPSYTDGCPDNLIWYIPFACDQQQSFVVSNSTCIVCALPEQMEN